jgi:ribonuclease HI
MNLYTDGSCPRNPDGPGGWAVIVVEDGNMVQQLSGSSPSTTNNIMEMTAVIEAIKFMPAGARFQVISDSAYVVNGINAWMGAWAKNGWAKKGGSIKNLPLWQMLYTIVEPDRMTFKHVRGHQGEAFNEMADELAGKEARSYA